ncbi:uncharacterized protein BO72DRAFT_444269 [Aspergillus fijiensis CBS 313.89]|uniref:Uncharacterized protein n=1 Tax=Aspergillus fijiensis CBS 313.89 TaxID=1448319 RepID=A0A8G1RXD5_9EURO|nr:uncharacterized protein BO72DRAFT_444269 [Aspergillus fijiensis CBS 313.89]RAK81757.1 hypothetical protein BO72DRAFT_444269 [Aspergillus fijiensis CBS 313.89]
MRKGVAGPSDSTIFPGDHTGPVSLLALCRSSDSHHPLDTTGKINTHRIPQAITSIIPCLGYTVPPW